MHKYFQLAVTLNRECAKVSLSFLMTPVLKPPITHHFHKLAKFNNKTRRMAPGSQLLGTNKDNKKQHYIDNTPLYLYLKLGRLVLPLLCVHSPLRINSFCV